MRLTVKTTDSLTLSPGKSDHIEFDDDVPGFGLRLREGGSRTWIYQYRIGSKQRRMVLGSAKSVPLSVARENACKLEAKVRLGSDPAMEKQIARLDADNTFVVLAEQYLEARRRDWRSNTYIEVKWYLMERAKSLHKVPIAAVSQRNVANLLNEVAESSGDVTSNRLRGTLSAFLGWVIREGIRLPEGNVASYTNKREERSRERVLSDPELRAIWAACQDDDFGAAIKLLMLTGQRENEIGSLRWDEVRDEQIVLPPERTKNKRSHIIPLSNPARAMLDRRRVDGRRHVFGRFDGGYSGWAKAKEKLDARIADASKALPGWTIHDIRRSVATGMAGLGVQPHIVEAVLNHVSGHKAGVAGTYNRASYDKEKREALNVWAEHVMALVEGREAVVVPMKRV